MGLYYEQQLEAKIKRQKSEITRLLKENEELKSDKAEGQQKAWNLAQKVYLLPEYGGYNSNELIEIFGTASTSEIFSLTYTEATAKVAEWKKAKEEICVGDVVRFKENHRVEFCVTNILDDRFLYGVSAEGDVYSDRNIKLFEKTGRHIDVDAWLAQIGGDYND